MMASLDGKKLQIRRMVREGRMIAEICQDLDLKWSQVRDYLASIGMSSWLGAKKALTNRLNDLETESDPAVRARLANDARRWINFLYQNGKRLSEQAEKSHHT